MKKVNLFISLIALSVVFNSCETDIPVNAELEDLPVVYAAIDPTETRHYVKINRAFLQDNVSAVDLAGDASNFNYGPNELDVIIEERSDLGNLIETIQLTRTENEIIKDPGVFDNSSNVLYAFTDSSINRNNTYLIKIFNNTLNKEITAETEIVGDISVINPNNQSKTSFFNGSAANGQFIDQVFRMRTGEDIGRVEATLIFNYIDHFTAASGLASISRSVRIRLGEEVTSTNEGEEEISFDLAGATFFDNIVGSVPDLTSIPMLSHREMSRLSIEFIMAGTELNTFIEVSEPSNNINQEKPPYTNVSNGLGIFSSRSKLVFTSSAGLPPQDINLSTGTMVKLNSLGLGFCFGITTSTSLFGCPN